MSRIGKKVMPLPATVEATIEPLKVTIKGPNGTLVVPTHPHVIVTLDSATRVLSVNVATPDDTKDSALWGLTRQLISNAVDGVQKPFTKSLEFNGVGFRVALEGKNLKMEVGFSHPVLFDMPQGITATVEKQIVTLSGIDKQLVGETAACIRRIRPPEPYKGKGIKYTTETIRRKAGKTATKA